MIHNRVREEPPYSVSSTAAILPEAIGGLFSGEDDGGAGGFGAVLGVHLPGPPALRTECAGGLAGLEQGDHVARLAQGGAGLACTAEGTGDVVLDASRAGPA